MDISFLQSSAYLPALEELVRDRLWLQLSQVLKRMFLSDEKAVPHLPSVYDGLVRQHAARLEGTALVQMAIRTSKLLPDPRQGIALLQDLLPVLQQGHSEAPHLSAWTQASMAHLLLRTADNGNGNSENAVKENAINECLRQADAFLTHPPPPNSTVTTSSRPHYDAAPLFVRAAIYRAKAEVAKQQGDMDAFCASGLSYVKTKALDPSTVKTMLKFAGEPSDTTVWNDLVLSALLSRHIFHFGELLSCGVGDGGGDYMLDGPLSTLLGIFNGGRLESWPAAQTLICAIPALKTEEPFLLHKLTLSALAELVFRSVRSSRNLSFAAIQDFLHLAPADQAVEEVIESLLLKAMVVGLFQGRIDPLSKVFRVQSVRPRILSADQVLDLLTTIRSWRQQIQTTMQTVLSAPR